MAASESTTDIGATAFGNLGLALAVIAGSMAVAALPLAGTLFVARGIVLADPIATLIVATIIAVSAVGLFRENVSFLLGRSPGPDYLARVEAEARSAEGVLAVHGGLTIAVPPDLSITEAHRIAEEARRRIHAETSTNYCVIHVEPAQTGDIPAQTPLAGVAAV